MPNERQRTKATIAAVEAAYELKASREDWLPSLIEANLPLLDHGLGVGGLVAVKPPVVGPPTVESMHVARGPEDLILRHGAAVQHLPTEVAHAQTVTGPFVLSEKTAQHPEMLRTWRSFFEGAEDALGFMTVDTDGRGIHVLAPTPHLVRLTPKQRREWEMISAHAASGLRLRHAIERAASAESSALPFGAEAVIDPSNFRVAEAAADARVPEALETLRQAAIRVDHARATGRKGGETHSALAEWWALIRGRWSIVDWFDSGGRRYVLALPNPPHVPNPRGLTKREQQVVAFAALGDSHKLIAYRLGLSRSRVTQVLTSSMRKLGVKTQAELVAKLRALVDTE